jgi:hypothetical protein
VKWHTKKKTAAIMTTKAIKAQQELDSGGFYVDLGEFKMI